MGRRRTYEVQKDKESEGRQYRAIGSHRRRDEAIHRVQFWKMGIYCNSNHFTLEKYRNLL